MRVIQMAPAWNSCLPCLLGLLLAALSLHSARAQVFVVTSDQYEARFLSFTPTDVALPAKPANESTRFALERALEAEQGFAMRPLPLSSHGLVLHANGELLPKGSAYVNELNAKGVSAKPGDRVSVTMIRFKPDRLILDLNGGPDYKHKYLRHVEIGGGTMSAPMAQQEAEPVGSRLTLVFEHGVPDLSGDQAKELIAPIVGFGVKSPAEAYSATLPPKIRKAVLEHHVLVGMSPEMVLHTMGQPEQRMRERDGQTPFEEWIYGAPPKHVEFVRFNGNRVIRVADADVGQTPQVRAENEMGDYWEAHPDTSNQRVVKLGDQTDTDREQQNSNPAPPSLRRPGETLPSDKTGTPTSQPVQFPTDKPANPS
jgi:hypothetical protein